MNDTKMFLHGLSQAVGTGKMVWYGTVPKEIYDLFQLNENDNKWHLTVMGVQVEIRPRFEVVSKGTDI